MAPCRRSDEIFDIEIHSAGSFISEPSVPEALGAPSPHAATAFSADRLGIVLPVWECYIPDLAVKHRGLVSA